MGIQRNVNYQIALIGNPNSGKSSVFNHLTGLRQRTGNFPGVTVEKLSGNLKLDQDLALRVIDFPGTYSLYPTSADERVVFDVLSHPEHADFPDLILYVADATRLDHQLLLLSQVRDLGIPCILAINLVDAAKDVGIAYDLDVLSQKLHLPVVEINGRTGEGFDHIHKEISRFYEHPEGVVHQPIGFKSTEEMNATIQEVKALNVQLPNDYAALILAHHAPYLSYVSPEMLARIEAIKERTLFNSLQAQYTEIMGRFSVIDGIIASARKEMPPVKGTTFTSRLDAFFTHVWWGPLSFLVMLFFVFQAVFTWSTLPMEWIEALFTEMGGMVRYALGEGWISSLISDGILAGLGGVLVFIPQIALLFLLISILEESGYMARAVYLFDRLMRKFGLNGRSLVALVSGTACAIPAIMSARTITNSRERLITILVTPFISCAARLPVYAVLVSLMIPSGYVWGLFSYQALVFLGLYLLGAVAALVAAWIFQRILKTDEPGFLLLELPSYQKPHWRNVVLTVWSKVASFVREAGRIILVISILLWFLSSYGPTGRMENAEAEVRIEAIAEQWDAPKTEDRVAAARIENSYAGIGGRVMEPVIRPLGFDWKIGIALLTSFAAREVFVGTMATIYAIGSSNEDEKTIRERMAAEINPETGERRYTFAVSLSLLLFYVFALQCMSTLAVVKKETGTWKWPLIQFGFMTGLAYICSLVVYQSLTYFGIQ